MRATLTDTGSGENSGIETRDHSSWVIARLFKNTKNTSMVDDMAEGVGTISYQCLTRGWRLKFSLLSGQRADPAV